MNLRKEYELSRLIKEDIQTEAAVEWLSSNIVLLNERMDRQGVSRLVQAVQRFDRKFGPFKDKLPAIALPLEAAEEGLRQVVSGDTNYARATDMFKHLMMVYNTLTNFFSADLPLLLRTPVFRIPSENPGVRLDSITGPGYDPKQIVKAFVKALKVAPEEVKLLGRVYRTVKMPSLDYKAIAQQLLSLSYDELKELTGTGRVPMAVTPDAQVGPPEPPLASEPVLEENVLSEAATPEAIGKSLSTLGQIINGTALSKTKIATSFKSLNSSFQQLLGTGKAAQVWDIIANPKHQSATGLKAAGQDAAQIWQTFKREKILLEQIDYTINLFKKLGSIWPTVIRPAFQDDKLSQEEVNNLTAIITKQLKPGWKSWIPGLAPKPFPGLAPADIAAAISELAFSSPEQAPAATQPTAPALTEAATTGEIEAAQPQSAASFSAGSIPNEANMASIEQFFTKLNTIFTKAPGITSPATGGSQPPAQTQTSEPPAPTTGAGPAAQTQTATASAPGAAPAPPPGAVSDTSGFQVMPPASDPANQKGLEDAFAKVKMPDGAAMVQAARGALDKIGYEVLLRPKQPSPKK